MYRSTNWIERWKVVTGKEPDKKLLKNHNWPSARTVREDAMTPTSRKFVRRKTY